MPAVPFDHDSAGIHPEAFTATAFIVNVSQVNGRRCQGVTIIAIHSFSRKIIAPIPAVLVACQPDGLTRTLTKTSSVNSGQFIIAA